MSSNRISDATRSAVAASVEKQGPKWAAIARQHGLSVNTVKNIATSAGLWAPAGADGQPEALESATERRLARSRALASELMVAFWEDAAWIRSKLRRTRNANALKANVISLAILTDKGLAVEAHVTDKGAEARGAIVRLVEELMTDAGGTESSVPTGAAPPKSSRKLRTKKET